MKQLCSSSDRRELTELLKRLLRIGIPCALCKDSSNAQLSVWVQQDNDLPLALKILAERGTSRPVPPWAYVVELPGPPAEKFALAEGQDGFGPATEGTAGPSVVLVSTRGRTRTGSVEGMGETGRRQPRGTQRREGWCWGPRRERF